MPAPLLCWPKEEEDAEKFGLNDDDEGDELWLAALAAAAAADEDKGCWDEGLMLLLLVLPLLVLVLVWLLVLVLVLTLAAPLLLFVVADVGAAPSVNVLIHCGPNFITAPDMVMLVN